MRASAPYELPPEQEKALRRARKLEWVTLAYLASAIVLLKLTLGASQAMKAAWLEDLLALIPPIAFLISSRVAKRPPNAEYPFGFQRATTIGYLCSSLALLGMGAYLLFESVLKLIETEHPTIGNVELFGRVVWLGYLMIPALIWSAVPAVLLGHAKVKLAVALHDKALHADALMNKADWMTATAAMLGIIGIGFGWWWADSAAATLIALDIAHDGARHLRAAVGDLMDRTPRTVDYKHHSDLPDRLKAYLEREPWVAKAEVRVREEGHRYFADALVVPRSEAGLVANIGKATACALALDWRLHDLVVTPVEKL